MKLMTRLMTLMSWLVLMALGSMARGATLTYGDGVTHVFNPDATLAGINVGSHAGDPSAPVNGDLWYSTSANALRARVNGATASVSLAGHGHVSADVSDASATPAVNVLAKYDGSGNLEANTITARGQLVTGQVAGSAGEIKFLDGASAFSFLFSLESPMTEDVTMLIPTSEGSEVVLASRNWANGRFAVGPAGAADNALARYDATTGRLLQSSQITASDTGALAGVTAVRAYDVAGLELQGVDASVALRVVDSLNTTAFGNWTFNSATANKVAGFNGTKALVPLDTLPAVNGAAVTNLSASNLASGTVPDARFPATLPAASGANLTALNASNLASGTVPDARFPATLPAASGANLTNLNAGNVSSGTLALAQGGTGGSERFSARRGLCSGVVELPLFLNANANLTGTGGFAGTTTGSYYPYVYAPAATASKSRCGAATDIVGSPFGGTCALIAGTGVPNFEAKWRFEFSAAVCLSAHTDSRVSFHLQCTNNPTTLDRPAVEGISIYWRGGASAGTAEIYTHDGTTGSSSSTGSVGIGDRATARWALEWEPGVGVRLYRNNVLLCTKTTNLPSGDSATSNSQGHYILCENTTNGVTHQTGMALLGGQILFFD